VTSSTGPRHAPTNPLEAVEVWFGEKLSASVVDRVPRMPEAQLEHLRDYYEGVIYELGPPSRAPGELSTFLPLLDSIDNEMLSDYVAGSHTVRATLLYAHRVVTPIELQKCQVLARGRPSRGHRSRPEGGSRSDDEPARALIRLEAEWAAAGRDPPRGTRRGFAVCAAYTGWE
jgi:hypothetical protein